MTCCVSARREMHVTNKNRISSMILIHLYIFFSFIVLCILFFLINLCPWKNVLYFRYCDIFIGTSVDRKCLHFPLNRPWRLMHIFIVATLMSLLSYLWCHRWSNAMVKTRWIRVARRRLIGCSRFRMYRKNRRFESKDI